MLKVVSKKIVVCVITIAVLSLMLSLLTACSPRLNGTYARTTDQGNVGVFTFSGNNQVKSETISPDGDILSSRTTTYILNKDKIVFSDWSDGYEGRELEIRIERDSFFLGPDEFEYKKR